MKTLKLLPALILMMLIGACATQISQEKLKSADYGPPPPDNYQEIIRNHFAKTLIDPTSPIYEFGTPRKGYTREAPLFNTHESFGWVVCGTLNSKNRFGGYVGSVPFFVLFHGDNIIEYNNGEVTDGGPYNISILNANIKNVCSR